MGWSVGRLVGWLVGWLVASGCLLALICQVARGCFHSGWFQAGLDLASGGSWVGSGSFMLSCCWVGSRLTLVGLGFVELICVRCAVGLAAA